MKTGEQITLGMLSDIEFSAETTAKYNAWAALDAIEEGMSDSDALLIYGLTIAALQPYKASWERQRETDYAY